MPQRNGNESVGEVGYLNEWSSDYIVEFEPGPAQTVWRRWYEFDERNEQDDDPP